MTSELKNIFNVIRFKKKEDSNQNDIPVHAKMND
jgi:hypothetical protein